MFLFVLSHFKYLVLEALEPIRYNLGVTATLHAKLAHGHRAVGFYFVLP